MKPSAQTTELFSAMVDGQLDAEEFSIALQACETDESALTSWNTYHLIGEMMRSPLPVVTRLQPGFLDRLNQRLAQEAVITNHSPSTAPTVSSPVNLKTNAVLRHNRGPASNDGSFRWKLLTGLASLAAVSAIAWNASGLLDPNRSSTQLAQTITAPQVLVASPQGTMLRDARLEALLAAHKQIGATSALLVPSGFLQNATLEFSHNDGR